MSGGCWGQKAAVKAIRPATPSEWSDAHAASSEATFFHGPVWSAVWESYTHGAFRASPLLVEFGDDATAVIGATTVPTRIPGLRRTLLSPAGDCGGWVSRDALTPAHATALADTIMSDGPVLWRRHPQDALACGVAIPGTVEEFTQIVDLRDGADAAIRRWKKDARRVAQRAEDAGVVVRQARTTDDWLAYHALYERVARRWSCPSPLYDWSFFSILAGLEDPAVELWLACLRGKVVGGTVNFRHGGHAVTWHGVTDRKACTGIAHLVDREMIRDLAARGVHSYDLNGSGPHDGVVRYKESIGASRAPVYAIERPHPLETAARRMKHLVAAGSR